jgi:hypothetical protein
MSSCCPSSKKEIKFGVKVCRERKCPELQKDPKWPDSPERCTVFNQMPGSLPCCIKDPEMKPEVFLKCIGFHLHEDWEHHNLDIKAPGPKNCRDNCPYKLSEMGEVFKKDSKGVYGKRPGKITRCGFTGEVLGGGGGSCMCHVLGNPDQEKQIETLKNTVFHRYGALFDRAACNVVGCPDGIVRCKAGDIICPVIKLPFFEIKQCPLERIPAKLLQKLPETLEKDTHLSSVAPTIKKEQEKPTKTRVFKNAKGEVTGTTTRPAEPAPEKKTRKEKAEDPVCEACRERFGKPVPDYACEGCKEDQEKRGRRAWTTELCLHAVHLGDMETLGKEIPDESVDMIFTDPPYLKDLYEQAYAGLATLAARVLKPHGFLITYAPQTHLDEIMDILRYTHESTTQKRILQYFWIISSLNENARTGKNHQRNAICLHKPILVFQKADDGVQLKGSRRCFADVVRGKRQKAFHPWQQSIHDVLGIISRFMGPGEILLDPFAGTGTSLIAANLLGMDWIGFEIDPKTHAIAVRELQQQPLGLQAFGIEAEAPDCERTQAEAPKDTSKQASIERKPKKEECEA